ncbi:hypothetical protein [Fontivita pretiosa]|uniref:hypothetical protein n=1 Tax=Fontivita pretiosa TaxID=2989684 RepID=UPI003D1688C9
MYTKEAAAVRLLEDCEQGLRRVLAEAGGQGDYASVLRIAAWARAVAALAAEARSAPPPSANPAAALDDHGSSGHSASVLSAGAGPRRKPAPGGYPRFFRRGDELVKVGWSKKHRQEYTHRAPRSAVDAVVAAVRELGAKGGLFSGDALLPLKDPSSGAGIPGYQAYVALAWLKHLGIVEQRGRRSGYTLVRDKQIESTITTAWPELAEWGR